MDHPKEPFKATEKAHLYGGPLDGRNVLVGADTHGYVNQEFQAIYTYCPHATARLGRNTFISQHIAHDALAH